MTEPASVSGTAAHVHRDPASAKIGMWLFVFSELVLFGGLFLAYSAYRRVTPVDFHHASRELNVPLGVTNTLVLLTSSLTVALSISALRQGKKRQSELFLAATVGLGCLFLVNKYLEWMAKIHHGIYPASPSLMELPPGERLFFGLYYVMTGLHGIHVLVGVGVLTVMLGWVARETVRRDEFIKLENAALYWHLVDIIWIFLLPLFYLAA